MWLVTTAKNHGFAQELARLCLAARRMDEFVFMGVGEQKLALGVRTTPSQIHRT